MTRSPARRFSLSQAFTQLQQQINSLPAPATEDSIVLRVLVQLLVTVGIVAVDVAAADVVDPLGVSLWAVPASAIGAAWSWYRRRHRNISVKFCIAIAMLGALAAFFLTLISRENDTRLVLAELLIQLQVLHSFDLPRRKDLGYSMMIGLILIGVAGTISQTLAFAPLLLLFLTIALPVLILDYRSRLGLLTHSLKQAGADLSPRRLGLVLLITAALGLAIFAFLPRLPGYQLRTFPVSSPIEFEGEFNESAILNPGYVRGGDEGTGTGSGDDWASGPGELDQQFYYGFNTRINQNLRGVLEPQIVMRVRSQAEGFWRVLAFDRYTGQGWEISRNDDESKIETLNRPFWSYRFFVPLIFPTKGERREVIQSYTITADLPNLIPSLYLPKEVYFPTEQIALDPEGGLRSPVNLSDGLTYTVVSEVPYRDRTALRSAATEYPDAIRNYYLDIPDAIRDRVRERTEAILANAPNPLVEPSEQALYLAQYLKQNYTILPDLPFLSEDQDLVEAFLFNYEGGYPDHFSTVLTVMLRSIGIPARLVVGFGTGEFNPFTGFYIVRNTDAYAMTEVYFPGYGWFAFDPIPGHEIVPPSFEQYQAFSVLRKFWQWIAGWLPSPVTGFLGGAFEILADAIGAVVEFVSGLFAQGWRGLFIGLSLLLAAGLAGWLTWSGWQTWRYRLWLHRLPPMEALYQQMLNRLADQGFRKAPTQTPWEYAQQSHDRYSPPQVAAIQDITQAYVQWRYGGRSPDLTHLKQRLKLLSQSQFKLKLNRRRTSLS